MSTETERMMTRQDRNNQIFEERKAAYDAIPGVRVGDYVRLPGGTHTRITHTWQDRKGQPSTVQTGGSPGGQYYLGDGYISYSGELDPGVHASRLRLLDYTMRGSVWFFKENWPRANGGINYAMDFRVFGYTEAGSE